MRHAWKWRPLALAAALCGTHAAAMVDVNQAPPDDLMTIKGIGLQTSARIVAARRVTPFRDWPDFIERMPGIGPQTAAKLSGQGLTVNGRRFDAPPGAAPARGPQSRTVPVTEWQPMVPRPLEPVR